MNYPELIYPNLYISANEASRQNQKYYFILIFCEYVSLTISAVLSSNFFKSSLYFSAATLVLFFSLLIFIIRTAIKPEKNWYQNRALAESIKTSTWRYIMRAEPFHNKNLDDARSNFVAYLKNILKSNRFLGRDISNTPADKDQITKEMDAIRSMIVNDRHKYYLKYRISEQRSWYSKKAIQSKKYFTLLSCIAFGVYFFAIFLSLLKISFPASDIFGIDPLIVIATSLIGWIQIKKYSELASAYGLTAHEIGLAEAEIQNLQSEHKFLSEINEAERAFSREHTQWVARQEENA